MKQPDGYYACSRPEIQELVRQDARTILDVGCGAGELGCELKQTLGAAVWGVEYVPAVAEVAASRLDRAIPGAIEDALLQLPDAYFDTIICADVLEHLRDPWRVLEELKHKLAPGGQLIGSIPNVRHWSVLKDLLEGRWQYRDAGILDRTHLRFFTWTDCILMLQQAGFDVVSAKGTMLKAGGGFPPAAIAALQQAGMAVDTLAEESQCYQFLFVAAPSSGALQAQQASTPAATGDAPPVSAGLTSIVILTWNQLPFTQTCLASIADQTSDPYELIVVDNGSRDGTVEWLRAQASSDSRIRVIENGENRGFAAGCNQGIAAARGEYILLLNNDTVVTPGWLGGLREVLERYPDAGIVGPMTNSASGVQVLADPGYPSLEQLSAWATAFREGRRYRTIPSRRIVGFCMLFRRGLVDQIGLLDESFGPGNYEDDDYCLRAELAGYRNVIAGDVFIHHEGGASFSGNRLDRGGENRRNRGRFREKWDPTRLEEAVLRRWLALNAIEEARLLAQHNQLDQAVTTLLQKGIKADPSSPEVYLQLAELLMATGGHSEALQVLSEMPPSVAKVRKLELEALCQTALGNDDLARQAAVQASETPRALVVLGTLAARSGDGPTGESCFRRAIQADPGCAQAWLSLGMLSWGAGGHEKAWQAVRCAALLDPLHYETIHILCDIASRLDRLGDAAGLIAEATALYPQSKLLSALNADLLSRCGQIEEAMAACETFLVHFGVDDEVLQLALQLRASIGPHDLLAEDGETITLTMIVKNEEQCLARCLASAKPVVHEMVVVDTGSSDRTVQIATAFGARVATFAWNGNFSDARNYAIEQARGKWVLVLDADEVISARDYPALREMVQADDAHCAWSVLTRNYTTKVHAQGWTANDGAYPAEEVEQGWHPSWKVRLFPRRDEIRFSGEVHEMVETSLIQSGWSVKKAPIAVHHYGGLEENEQQFEEKRGRYFEIGMRKLEKNPNDLAALIELAVQAGELRRFAEAVELWDRVLKIDPANTEALFNKGYALMGQRRYGEALTITAQVLGLVPDHKEAAFNYATCCLYAGSPEEGAAVAADHSRRNPEYPPLYAVLTALALAAEDLAVAGNAAAQLRRLNYDIGDYIAQRAEILQQLGRQPIAERLRQGWLQLARALSSDTPSGVNRSS